MMNNEYELISLQEIKRKLFMISFYINLQSKVLSFTYSVITYGQLLFLGTLLFLYLNYGNMKNASIIGVMADISSFIILTIAIFRSKFVRNSIFNLVFAIFFIACFKFSNYPLVWRNKNFLNAITSVQLEQEILILLKGKESEIYFHEFEKVKACVNDILQYKENVSILHRDFYTNQLKRFLSFQEKVSELFNKISLHQEVLLEEV